MRQQILNLFTTPRDMSWENILLNIVLAAVLGFFIFLSYAISHRGTIYSRKCSGARSLANRARSVSNITPA